MKAPYLLVAADFVATGGMDVANLAFAQFVADQRREVHLVAHSVDPALAAHPSIRFHRAPRPARADLVGERFLDVLGRFWSRRLASRTVRVLVNGGNCQARAFNWAHYVHAADPSRAAGALPRRLKHALARTWFKRNERLAYARAIAVFADSEKTREDLIRAGLVERTRVEVVYYGVDAARFSPAAAAERASLRRQFPAAPDARWIAFVGSLGDTRKGFDVVYSAFRACAASPDWKVELVVAGRGAQLEHWKRHAQADGLARQVHFLGFRDDVPALLRASDLLVSPTRYEPYGLAVHEALCAGLPAIVSREAGVAERYPPALHSLLLEDPEDAEELELKLREWYRRADTLSAEVAPFSASLRQHGWESMAAQIYEKIEQRVVGQ